MLLKFNCLDNPIAFDGCEELVHVLRGVLCGWGGGEVVLDESSETRPQIKMRRGPGGYERTSPWIKGAKVVLADPVDAVCDLLLDLERAYIGANDNLLALHAAAVEFDGGLTVFPSTHNAGKSTLCVLLGAAWAKVYADDVTPIIPGKDGKPAMGVSPGLLPRLRLPLPDDLGDENARFINSRHGPKSESFLYVKMDKNQLAPLGQSAPVNRIVLLQREPGTTTQLVPAKNSEILKYTIMQSIGHEIDALEMLDNLNAMVGSAECLTLKYGTSADAARVLMESFGA